MKSMVGALLNVRNGPRPDPLPDDSGDAWSMHAPYMGVFLVVLLAALLLDTQGLGLLACGAGLGAVVTNTIQRRVRQGCMAVHFGAGVLVVGLFHGAASAGALALPVGLYLAAALGARAAAAYFSPAVAPLAGRVPWRFEDCYRHHARRFAVAGGLAALVLVAFSSHPVYRVLGVAILPLVLRSYSGQMLSPDARRQLWAIVAAFQAIALLLFVRSHGALAAAWMIVISETFLFVASALVIADRTGVKPSRRQRWVIAVSGGMVVLVAAIPGGPALHVMLGFIVVAAAGVALWWRHGST